jgi:hypothetical protein
MTRSLAWLPAKNLHNFQKLEPYRQCGPAAVVRGAAVDYSLGETGRHLAPLSFAELSSKAARVVVASSIKNCW